MRKEDPDRKMHSFAFRIEHDLYEKLLALADRYHVPYTQIQRWALLEYIDEHWDDDQTSHHRMPS